MGEENLDYITALLYPLPNALIEKERKKSISQVFVQLWLLRPMAGDSHYWVAGVESLDSSRTCLGSVAHVLPRWLIPPTAGDMREPGVTRGSVQSQEWLSVLILSLLLMFQGPSFYHRLRSNKMGRKEKRFGYKQCMMTTFWNVRGHSDFIFPLLRHSK